MLEHLKLLHKSSIYAVVAAAFFALASGGHLRSPTIVAFCGAVLASWFVDAAGWTRRDHVPWWNALVAVCLVLSALHVAFLGASVLMAAVRFLLLLTAVRLVSRHRVRDELQLYALAFLMMAAGAALNDAVAYGIAFAAFVLTGTFSLALFHLKRELEGPGAATPFRAIPFDRQYVAVLGGLSVAIFATSLVLFVGFPRVGLGFFETDARAGVRVSGFSDSVKLGTHGISRDNPEVVLRIRFPGGRPGNYDRLHWRTLTFDAYDGRSWHRTLSDREPGRLSRDPYDLSDQYGPEMPEGTPEEIPAEIEMYVEPLGSDVLPTLWPTDTVAFELLAGDAPPGSPRSGSVGVDAYGDLSHSVESSIGIPYTLRTRRRPDPGALRDVRVEMPPDRPGIEPFLQLPRPMERIEQLAERVTDGADSPYAKARAVERYFARDYTYTTELPAYGGETPVENFLFETRRGHCEYYATAMVLMLRTLEIPARLVNGFLGGTWNSVGGYLAVRQQDAHSWVEFYLPGYGWIPMDPTPAGSIHRDDSSPLDWFRESYDALQMVWFQWIIEYDLDTQLRLLRDLSDWAGARAPDDESAAPDREDADDGSGVDEWGPIVRWAGIGLLALLALATTRRFDARYERWKIGANAAFWSAAATGWSVLFAGFAATSIVGGLAAGFGGAAVGLATALIGRGAAAPPTRLFERIERSAHRAGVDRRPGEPPAAFLNRLADEFPDLRDELANFRRRYLAARFGGRSFDAEARRRAERAVDAICDGMNDRASRSSPGDPAA